MGAIDSTPERSRVTVLAVVALLTLSSVGAFAGSAAGASANTSDVSLALDDYGISTDSHSASWTNHDWSVTVDSGVSETLTSIAIDYSGTGTTFKGMSTRDVTIKIGGTVVGPLEPLETKNSGERLIMTFRGGAEQSLSGDETITVSTANGKISNPSTTGSHQASIELHDGGGQFASASTSFTTTAGTVTGSVTNATDGSTVSGATVTVEEGFRSVASTTTDASGDYSLDVGPGTYDVTIDATDYDSATTKDVQVVDGGTQTIDAALTLAGTIRGKVTETGSNTAISGAQVLLYDSQTGKNYFTMTDGTGAYSQEVAPGSYEVEFSADGYGSAASTVSVAMKETKIADASLDPATSTISGTVTDGANAQRQYVEVTATDAKTDLQVDSATTDASGTYTLNVSAGSYTVETSLSGYAKGSASVDIGDSAAKTQDFTLQQAGTVSGTVTSDDGSALSGMWVMVYDPAAGKTVKSTQTNPSGAYSMDVGSGTYDVIAYDSSGNYEDGFEFGISVTSGATTMAIVTMAKAPPKGTITGTVTDPNGNPVSGATVEAVDETYRNFKQTTTDGSGKFSLSVPEGTYTVTASESGYAQGVTADVSVSGNAKTAASVQLSQAAYIEGTITNASGSVRGATVVADSGSQTLFTQTDANGDYKLTVAPDESYRVSVYAQNQSGQTKTASPATGATATVDVSMKKTEVKHSSVEVLNPSGVQTNKIGLSAEVQQGMMMVQITNESSSGMAGRPDELEGLGVDRDTKFEINLTVTNYDPSTLLWGARNVEWSTSQNDSNPAATDVTIRASAVDLQAVNDLKTTIGPLMTKQPSDVQWPSGHNDRAGLGWNRTVYFGLFDMSSAPSEVRDRFGGMTVTTNAQTFAPPRVENGTLKVWVAGPHRTVDGNTHSGFYEATIPDSQLQEWGVDPANAKDELQVMYQGNEQSFTVTDLADGVRISLDIHYSAGTVAVSPSASAGSSSSNGATGGGSVGNAVTEQPAVSTTNVGNRAAVLHRVTADEPVVVDVAGVNAGDVGVTEANLSFDVGSVLNNDVAVTAATIPPASVTPAGDATILSYVTIEVDGNLEGHESAGSFAFTVSEDRLADLGAEPDDVRVYHYDETDDAWVAIPTTNLGDGSYEATTESFSTFAIGIDPAAAQTATATPEPTPASTPMETATTTPTAIPDSTPASTAATPTSSGAGPGFGAVAALLAIAMVAFGQLRRRR